MARTKAHEELTKDLEPRILECIRQRDNTARLMTEATGLSRATIDKGLSELEAKELVHYVYAKGLGGRAIRRWELGPGDDDLDVTSELDRPIVVRTPAHANYPAVGIRDPLVAALFGAPGFTLQAPKQSAPRCIACGIEQGAGHAVNCIVALVAA